MRPYPLPGETVGPFRIDRRLGGGDRSTVYAARQVRSEQPVALKVMSTDVSDNTAERRRIALAARQVVAVGSPHVARVHLYGQHDSRLFVASDLVAEGPLSRILRRQGGAPVGHGVDLMAQVASGVAALHGRGVVHGALTPSNVLVSWRDARPCGIVVDAGMSRHDTAPEVHLGGPRTLASDIHSLGVLAFWVLTGARPAAGTPYQVADAFVRGHLPTLAGSSPRVAQLNATLARAMHLDASARQRSAAELRSDLLWSLALPGEQGPLRAVPPRPERRPRQVLGRRR